MIGAAAIPVYVATMSPLLWLLSGGQVTRGDAVLNAATAAGLNAWACGLGLRWKPVRGLAAVGVVAIILAAVLTLLPRLDHGTLLAATLFVAWPFGVFLEAVSRAGRTHQTGDCSGPA